MALTRHAEALLDAIEHFPRPPRNRPWRRAYRTRDSNVAAWRPTGYPHRAVAMDPAL